MKPPKRFYWFLIGVFFALGNFLSAAIALIKGDNLFTFLLGVGVGTFLSMQLIEILKIYGGGILKEPDHDEIHCPACQGCPDCAHGQGNCEHKHYGG